MGGKWRCLSPPWSLKHRDATLDVHPARLLLRRAGFLGAVGLGRLFEDVRRTHGPGSVSAHLHRRGKARPRLPAASVEGGAPGTAGSSAAGVRRSGLAGAPRRAGGRGPGLCRPRRPGARRV